MPLNGLLIVSTINQSLNHHWLLINYYIFANVFSLDYEEKIIFIPPPFFFIISVIFCHFGYFFAIFGKKNSQLLSHIRIPVMGGFKKITSLPPVIIIKIKPTIHFWIYRVCVLPGQSKFVMVAVRIIIKPLCFSMMNKILSFFAILATFLAIFGKKNTSNFPAQYRIDHLLLRISQIQSVQSILLQRFTFWHGVTALTVWTVKKVKSSLFCTMNLEKKENEKMIISSFLGPPNKW